MDSGHAAGGGEEDGDEANMVNGWNIRHNGASPVCRGILGVDVFGVF